MRNRKHSADYFLLFVHSRYRTISPPDKTFLHNQNEVIDFFNVKDQPQNNYSPPLTFNFGVKIYL